MIQLVVYIFNSIKWTIYFYRKESGDNVFIFFVLMTWTKTSLGVESQLKTSWDSSSWKVAALIKPPLEVSGWSTSSRTSGTRHLSVWLQPAADHTTQQQLQQNTVTLLARLRPCRAATLVTFGTLLNSTTLHLENTFSAINPSVKETFGFWRFLFLPSFYSFCIFPHVK